MEEDESGLLPQPVRNTSRGLEIDGERREHRARGSGGMKHLNADDDRYASRQRTGSPAETPRRPSANDKRDKIANKRWPNSHCALAQR